MNNVPELEAIVFALLMDVREKMGLEEFSVTLPCFVFTNLMELVPQWKTGEIISRRRKKDGVRGIQVRCLFESMHKEQGHTEIRDSGNFFRNEDGSSSVFGTYIPI